LSAPTIINPSAAVIDKPMNSATTTATMIRNDFSAIHRINSTTARVMTPFIAAPSRTVANSSFSIGTGPVRRTRAW
jgi:hypothetical protein